MSGWRGLSYQVYTGNQRDVFQRITDAVGIVISGVDAPLVARLGMMGELDAVCHRVELAVLRQGQ